MLLNSIQLNLFGLKSVNIVLVLRHITSQNFAKEFEPVFLEQGNPKTGYWFA
jgi:hypothetical protein